MFPKIKLLRKWKTCAMLSKACSFLPLVENQLCFLSSILAKCLEEMTSGHSSKVSIVICVPPSFLAEQNREGGDAGSRAGRRPAPLAASSTERECWSNTEKWPCFATVTVLTSELPPRRPPCPNFEKSVQIWEMDAVGNCIQNYQAQVILFKVPIRSQKIPPALFWLV